MEFVKAVLAGLVASWIFWGMIKILGIIALLV